MFAILKNRKGVTLVELLAVIVIMGIIAAIAVPTIGGLIDRQREKAAEASYESILDTARTYATEMNLVATNEFTISDMVTAGYFAENPFDGATVVEFTVGASGAITVTGPVGDIIIDTIVVATIS